MPDSRTPFYIVYVFVVVAYGGYAMSIWLRARRIRERMREGMREGMQANGAHRSARAE